MAHWTSWSNSPGEVGPKYQKTQGRCMSLYISTCELHLKAVPAAWPGARDVHRAGGLGDVAFHKGQSEISRPHAVAITAGVAHSSCLTRSGVVLAWRSWDANLAVQEVSAGLAGKKIVSIAAGMYHTVLPLACEVFG